MQTGLEGERGRARERGPPGSRILAPPSSSAPSPPAFSRRVLSPEGLHGPPAAGSRRASELWDTAALGIIHSSSCRAASHALRHRDLREAARYGHARRVWKCKLLLCTSTPALHYGGTARPYELLSKAPRPVFIGARGSRKLSLPALSPAASPARSPVPALAGWWQREGPSPPLSPITRAPAARGSVGRYRRSFGFIVGSVFCPNRR